MAHEAAARLAQLLQVPISVTTVRRQTLHQTLPSYPAPTKIGIDDFAFRRGKTYGTLIVDLEIHRIIDLLPDRTATTVEQWLRAHPEVILISRDREGEYALAAARVAPQAVQVADRFHLLMHAGECLERFIQRHPPLLQDGSLVALPRTARRSLKDRTSQHQRTQRRGEQFARVQDLTQQRKTQREIGQLLDMARGTVIR